MPRRKRNPNKGASAQAAPQQRQQRQQQQQSRRSVAWAPQLCWLAWLLVIPKALLLRIHRLLQYSSVYRSISARLIQKIKQLVREFINFFERASHRLGRRITGNGDNNLVDPLTPDPTPDPPRPPTPDPTPDPLNSLCASLQLCQLYSPDMFREARYGLLEGHAVLPPTANIAAVEDFMQQTQAETALTQLPSFHNNLFRLSLRHNSVTHTRAPYTHHTLFKSLSQGRGTWGICGGNGSQFDSLRDACARLSQAARAQASNARLNAKRSGSAN
eukprot:m.37607 g.37607  ORF g.37607 m.37607 type:complete len:273 (-) comp10114_c1_seq1:4630-5448(-)